MAYREYHCTKCRKTQCAFENEEHKLLSCGCGSALRKMPPSPMVIHATEAWMTEICLDSYTTTYELDRQLTIEAEQSRETKALDRARREL